MRKMNNMQTQQGFTIIELVVVILLLGILTATALPRFIDVTEQAHSAAVDGAEGGLATGMALFHAQWIANGQGVAAITEYNLLFPSTSGYPAGLANVLLNTHAECAQVFLNVLQSGAPTVRASGGAAGAIVQGDVDTVITNGDDYLAKLTGTQICTYAYVQDDADITGTGESAVRGLTYNAITGAVARVDI